MVVTLETVTALVADVYPACGKVMGRECVPEGPRRQKVRKILPALVEDDSEPETPDTQEFHKRRHVPNLHTLRRQNSISPQRREKMRRQLVLPSLSEDEEP